MDLLGQSALILAVTAFSLAITALSRNLKNKLILSFALLCSVISLWALFFFFEKISGAGFFYKIHLTFNLLLAPVGLFFVGVLTRVETKFTRTLYLVSVIYSAVIIVLQWTNLSRASIVQFAAFFGPSFLVLQCFYLMFSDWAIKKRGHLNTKISTIGLTQRTWIYIGALIILGSAVMDRVPMLGDIVPTLANIAVCAYLFIVSEAIVHQRLFNPVLLLNRIIVLVFISACFSLIYIFLVFWIQNSVSLFILNSFLASLIILILYEPFKKLTHFTVVYLFSRKYIKFQRIVDQNQKDLTGTLDSSGLAQLTLRFLQDVFQIESASVFFLRSDETKYRRIRGLNDDSLQNREILATHPMVEFFLRLQKKNETPVILDHYLINEVDRATSQAQRDTFDVLLRGLQALDANIAIPFLDQNRVLGFVSMKVQNPPEPWGNNWGVLSFIYPFFVSASQLLKNMDIYVKQREKERLATLGEMSAGLAHEIRNPLGAIKGAAQFLENSIDSVSISHQPFLQVIIEEVNRLNKVVTQFLDYSKPLQPELREYSLCDILEKTHQLYKKSDEKIKIELIFPEDGSRNDLVVKCEPEQIKQVLVNLIQNSMTSLSAHTPDIPKITIGAYLTKNAGDKNRMAVLFVEDNGRGISKENLEKIFIPFFTTSSSGTGLGLSISSRIIEAHQGRFEVQSEERKFTRFSIFLPVD